MLSIYIYTHTIYKYMRGIYIYNTNIQTSAVLQTACNLISAITDFSKLRSWHIRLGGSHIRGWWSLLASRDWLMQKTWEKHAENPVESKSAGDFLLCPGPPGPNQLGRTDFGDSTTAAKKLRLSDIVMLLFNCLLASSS